MAPDGENFRGVNAVRIFSKGDHYTLDKVIADGYDTKLSIFEILIPKLISVFEKDIKPSDPEYAELLEPISILKNWDYYAKENSVATTLAVEWAYKLDPIILKVYIDEGELDQIENTKNFAATATVKQLIPQLQDVLKDLKSKWGTWQVAWGEINRFQRSSGDIDLKYDDSKPSLPVAFGPGSWGSLPSFKSSYQNDSKKRYGYNGNSFVCAVEFGPKIKAKSLLAGGNSGDPNSKHFDDQAEMYQKGTFKDVLFYKEDVIKNAEKTYHPGE